MLFHVLLLAPLLWCLYKSLRSSILDHQWEEVWLNAGIEWHAYVKSLRCLMFSFHVCCGRCDYWYCTLLLIMAWVLFWGGRGVSFAFSTVGWWRESSRWLPALRGKINFCWSLMPYYPQTLQFENCFWGRLCEEFVDQQFIWDFFVVLCVCLCACVCMRFKVQTLLGNCIQPNVSKHPSHLNALLSDWGQIS